MPRSASNIISFEQKTVFVVGAIELRLAFNMFLRVLERREPRVSQEVRDVDEALVIDRNAHVFSIMPKSHRHRYGQVFV